MATVELTPREMEVVRALLAQNFGNKGPVHNDPDWKRLFYNKNLKGILQSYDKKKEPEATRTMCKAQLKDYPTSCYYWINDKKIRSLHTGKVFSICG